MLKLLVSHFCIGVNSSHSEEYEMASWPVISLSFGGTDAKLEGGCSREVE
jgi:hypothetical protein